MRMNDLTPSTTFTTLKSGSIAGRRLALFLRGSRQFRRCSLRMSTVDSRWEWIIYSHAEILFQLHLGPSSM